MQGNEQTEGVTIVDSMPVAEDAEPGVRIWKILFGDFMFLKTEFSFRGHVTIVFISDDINQNIPVRFVEMLFKILVILWSYERTCIWGEKSQMWYLW